MAKILIVDDEASIRFFLEEMLTRDQHEVVAVDSGEAALVLVEDAEFDLALVDLKMPGVGGTEVLASIRETWPDTPVIMLTGHGSLETAVEALRQGAHDYLFKPCKTVEIRESVRAGLIKRQQKRKQRNLLQQLELHLAHSLQNVRETMQQTGTADVESLGLEEVAKLVDEVEEADETEARFLKRGGLMVDFMRHVITLDEELLELSPTEFDVLAHLVSEAPRVVTPQELLREVQGYESEPWEARDTVRYHIYRIRQKIKAATDREDIIETVRGVGYTIK